jgi:hypothetical protein
VTALYEAILVQDPHLLPPGGTSGSGPDGPSRAGLGGTRGAGSGGAIGTGPNGRHDGLIARNPYKGLRPFTEADAADFFGRDELVRSMLAVLRDPDRPLLAVVGPSGCGKSSVVHAGLVPAVRADGISGLGAATVVTSVPGHDRFGALAAALCAATDVRTLTPDAGPSGPHLEPGPVPLHERWLAELIAQSPAKPPVVIVLDQFEELFTLVDDRTVQRRFLDAIDQAPREHGEDLRVVVAMRADLFDRPLAHPAFGHSGTGAMVAAEELPEPDRPLWGIGVDTDWELTHPRARRPAPHLDVEAVRRRDARPGAGARRRHAHPRGSVATASRRAISSCPVAAATSRRSSTVSTSSAPPSSTARSRSLAGRPGGAADPGVGAGAARRGLTQRSLARRAAPRGARANAAWTARLEGQAREFLGKPLKLGDPVVNAAATARLERLTREYFDGLARERRINRDGDRPAERAGPGVLAQSADPRATGRRPAARGPGREPLTHR